MQNSTRLAIGQRIQYFRHRRGLTQTYIAKKCDVSQSFIYQIECGITAPNIDMLVRICGVMDISASEILKGL